MISNVQPYETAYLEPIHSRFVLTRAPYDDPNTNEQQSAASCLKPFNLPFVFNVFFWKILLVFLPTS